jgi:hypothetical protein
LGKAGVRLVRPLVVIISCLLALRLATAQNYSLHDWLINFAKPWIGG